MAVADKPVVIVDEITDRAHAYTGRCVSVVEALVDDTVERTLTGENEGVTIDGTVTLDSGAAARGRMDLTIVGLDELIPTMPTDLLVPYRVEIRISRGVEFPDRVELVRLGIFPVDHAVARDGSEGPTIAIDGNDRDGRLIAPENTFETAGQIVSGTVVTTAILNVLQQVDPAIVVDFAATAVTLPTIAYDEGEDRGAFCQGLAKSIGGELYRSRNGIPTLRPVPSAGEGSVAVAEIAEGEGGTLLEVDRDWDRSRVFNKVVVTGENSSLAAGSTPPRGEAIDTNPLSPTYYYGDFGKRPYPPWNSPYISTNTQAADAASGILARTIGAPDVVSLGALVDPARWPGDVVFIERGRLGLAANHILDTVSIPLSATGQMTATTRATQVL